MAGTPFKDGPAYITTSSDDLYVPSSNTYALVRHIHVANTSASSCWVSLFVGATGAEAGGTELVGQKVVAANDVADFYFPAGLKLTTADFLVGDAQTGSVLTATITGELYAA